MKYLPLVLAAALTACAFPSKKKTPFQAWKSDAQNTGVFSTGRVVGSSVTVSSSDIYMSSLTVNANQDIWFNTGASSAPHATPYPAAYFRFADQYNKAVYYHADGRITWSGGFKSDREVIRFLVEMVAQVNSGHKYPLK